MDRIGAYEAKTRFSSLLEEVAKGKKVLITKRGKPVAQLVPVESRDLDETIKEILDFRRKHSLKGLSLKEMIEEGRRF
ncbi:MAG: type II toxin-antitoxin system prevent-host-death family antitoxin [Aquificota bacterium]|nr:MAG: type II toxin-antitoxin system prevent-host-death family antitoxin [Aquificota bacterium]